MNHNDIYLLLMFIATCDVCNCRALSITFGCCLVYWGFARYAAALSIIACYCYCYCYRYVLSHGSWFCWNTWPMETYIVADLCKIKSTLVPCTWYHVLTWCRVLGTTYLVRTKYTVPRAWCQVTLLGFKYLVPSTGHQASAKYLVPSTRCQVFGTKYLVPRSSTW